MGAQVDLSEIGNLQACNCDFRHDQQTCGYAYTCACTYRKSMHGGCMDGRMRTLASHCSAACSAPHRFSTGPQQPNAIASAGARAWTAPVAVVRRGPDCHQCLSEHVLVSLQQTSHAGRSAGGLAGNTTRRGGLASSAQYHQGDGPRLIAWTCVRMGAVCGGNLVHDLVMVS